MARKFFAILSVIILASFVLVACGGSSTPVTAPAPFSKMTVSTALEDTRKTMEEKEKASLPAGFNMELKAYTTDSSADEVTAYYKDTLKDWTSQDTGAATPGLTFLKWSKDTNVFVVIMTAKPDGSAGQVVYTEFVSK
jgi:hypothetical protein